MKITALFAIGAIAGGAGTLALAGDGEKSKPKMAYENYGEPVRCIQLRNIRTTNVIDDQTIDFKMAGGKIYRNRLNGRCSGLGFEERFSYRTSLDKLCDVDIIHVLHNYGGRLQEGASCGLGKFQEVRLIKPEKD